MTTTYTSRDAEACAYLSALVTVELCAEVHRKGKVNTAIRRCVNRQLPGLVEHKRVYLIFKGLAKQPFPAGVPASSAAHAGGDGGRASGVGGVMIKLEFLTDCDAQHGDHYLQDRGYKARLMGKALVVDKPDSADLALVMTTYRAFTVDLAEGDTCA